MNEGKEQINFENGSDWPVFKLSLRNVLESLGATLNQETGKYEIADTPSLDVFPILLEDDGMGYGVNQQYISELYFHDDPEKPYCSIFREYELPELDKWLEADTFPWETIEYRGETFGVTGITRAKDGSYEAELTLSDDYDTKLNISYDELIVLIKNKREERERLINEAHNKEE